MLSKFMLGIMIILVMAACATEEASPTSMVGRSTSNATLDQVIAESSP